jgi:hypothetical protein
LGAKTQTSHREQGGVDEKVPIWSWAKCWRNNYILELVKSRALLGELQLQQRKEQPGEIIKNYYPAVLDEATWRWRICSRRWKAARSRRWNACGAVSGSIRAAGLTRWAVIPPIRAPNIVATFPPMFCPPESMNADHSTLALSVKRSVKATANSRKFWWLNPNSL